MEPPVGVRVVAAGDIACAPGEPVTEASLPAGGDRGARRSRSTRRWCSRSGTTQYPQSSLPQLMRLLRQVLGRAARQDATHDRQPRVLHPWREGLLRLLQGPPARASRLLPAQRRQLEDHRPEQQLHQGQLRRAGGLDGPRDEGLPGEVLHRDHAPPALLLRQRARQQHGGAAAVGRRPTSTATTSCSPATTTTTSGSRRMDGLGHRPRQRHAVASSSGPAGRTSTSSAPGRPGRGTSRPSQHGVLALDLRQGSFGWKFHGIDGSVLDEGARPCV